MLHSFPELPAGHSSQTEEQGFHTYLAHPHQGLEQERVLWHAEVYQGVQAEHQVPARHSARVAQQLLAQLHESRVLKDQLLLVALLLFRQVLVEPPGHGQRVCVVLDGNSRLCSQVQRVARTGALLETGKEWVTMIHSMLRFEAPRIIKLFNFQGALGSLLAHQSLCTCAINICLLRYKSKRWSMQRWQNI